MEYCDSENKTDMCSKCQQPWGADARTEKIRCIEVCATVQQTIKKLGSVIHPPKAGKKQLSAVKLQPREVALTVKTRCKRNAVEHGIRCRQHQNMYEKQIKAWLLPEKKYLKRGQYKGYDDLGSERALKNTLQDMMLKRISEENLSAELLSTPKDKVQYVLRPLLDSAKNKAENPLMNDFKAIMDWDLIKPAVTEALKPESKKQRKKLPSKSTSEIKGNVWIEFKASDFLRQKYGSYQKTLKGVYNLETKTITWLYKRQDEEKELYFFEAMPNVMIPGTIEKEVKPSDYDIPATYQWTRWQHGYIKYDEKNDKVVKQIKDLNLL